VFQSISFLNMLMTTIPVKKQFVHRPPDNSKAAAHVAVRPSVLDTVKQNNNNNNNNNNNDKINAIEDLKTALS